MVEDVTRILDKEEGTAFDQRNILFQTFDDADSFNYGNALTEDYEQMFKQDGKSRTLEQVLTLPIRQAPCSIQRGRSPKEVHDLVERTLMSPAYMGGMSTPINMVISQMTGAIVHRKAYFEKVFTRREGMVVYDKVAWRPPSTCNIVRDKRSGAFKGFKQELAWVDDGRRGRQTGEPVLIKPERAFVYIHGTHRDPLNGVSDLEIAWWCFQTKQKIRFLWYQFLEGQSLPKTIVKHRDQATANRVARKITALRQGGVIGVEEDADIQPFESSGKGAAQFQEALRWLDSEASGSVLAGFTDLGSQAAGGTGSFALSKDQTDFFLMSRQATAREMQDAMNAHLIPDLVYWNFGPNVVPPTFEFGPIAQDDAATAVSLLQATAQSPTSMIPREFFDELIERVAGFLELDTQTVRKGLDRARKEAEEAAANATPNPAAPAVAGMTAAVNTATRMVTGGNTPPRAANVNPATPAGLPRAPRD